MSRKTLPTRRRRALGRILAAAVTLLLADRVFHVALLPIQVVRQQEEALGTGRTAVVERRWEPEVPEAHGLYQMYLAGNQQVTFVKGARLSWLTGWEGALLRVLDCSQPAPLYAETFALSQGEDRQRVQYLFARVDDPAIAELRAGGLTTCREDWLTCADRTYVLAATETAEPESVTAYDSNGTPLYTLELG